MSKKLIPVYAIFLADDKGSFDWVYMHPKPYYQSKEEADKIREELIKSEETVTKENSKVKKLWKVPK